MDDNKSDGQSKNDIAMSNKIKRTSNEGLFMSVSVKAQKIATALYLLSDLIKEDDPMRHSIRTLSLKIVSDARGLSNSLTGDLYFHIERIIAISWELVSFIEISTNVGFISDMNYHVIKSALVGFIGDLRNRQRIEGFKNIEDLKINTVNQVGVSLKEEFFRVNKEDLLDFGGEEASVDKPVILKDTKINNGHIKNTPENIRDRKDQIHAFIKENKEVIVKDIMDKFNGHNKKTIQRDLISLMAEGKIKRTGEKRWSRYSSLDN